MVIMELRAWVIFKYKKNIHVDLNEYFHFLISISLNYLKVL